MAEVVFQNRFLSNLNFFRERYMVATLPFHSDIVLAVHCIGQIGYSGGRDGTCAVFNIKTATLIKQFKAHKFGLSCFEQCNSDLVTAGWDGKAIIWTINLQTDQIQSRVFNNQQPVICVKIHGNKMACGLENGVRIWDFDDNSFTEMDTGLVTCIDYSNEFVYGKSNMIKDVKNEYYFNAKVSAMKIKDRIHVGTEVLMAIQMHSDGIRNISINHNIVTASYDQTIGIYNQRKTLWKGHKGDVNDDQTVKIWNCSESDLSNNNLFS
ncbi:hypothetical protein HK103_001792 [Boothiomyces macroporosus]|uniref:Uncharacterized protein n=1 Tax=Boothiomyces macroporosus TaxID=261099 RepID=A0AAD5UAG8_9FUNG|nr:hypothetical protein HK103_001792 [Boothiomyces macroporosus]